MKFLYNIAVYASYLFIWIGSLFSHKLFLFCTGRKGLLNKMWQCANLQANTEVVWFHCSSVGEFEQARPIIEWHRANYPSCKILLTFFSPSGYELRKNYDMADWVYYLPLDTMRNARRFIEIFHPAKVVFTKYDLWYNFIQEASYSGAKLYLISAIFRPYQAFFKWYGGFFRQMLKRFSAIFVQDEESAKNLRNIGLTENVIVAGDTRFDRVASIAAASRKLPEIEEFTKDSFIVVAGSSWPPDEEVIAGVMKNFSNVRLVIAPHETDKKRVEEVGRTFDSYGVIKYSELTNAVGQPLINPLIKDKRVLLIDCIGLLSSIYKFANLAYIGGGFGAGIHNVLEAAVYGCPVVFGPGHQRFQEALDLIECGGATCVSSQAEFYQILDKCVKEKGLQEEMGELCKRYVRLHCGATEKIVSQLQG